MVVGTLSTCIIDICLSIVLFIIVVHVISILNRVPLFSEIADIGLNLAIIDSNLYYVSFLLKVEIHVSQCLIYIKITLFNIFWQSL